MRKLDAGAHRRLRSTAYAALDAAFLGRGVPRRVNGEWLRFPAAWSRYYPATYEEAKHRFLLRHCRAGTTVIDGGAHIGLFTVAMARAVGPEGSVLAFEPTPSTRAVLAATIALNDVGATVSVRPEALSNATGRTTFHIGPVPGTSSNSVFEPPPEGPGSEREVPAVALDDLVPSLFAPVSCIKLDIEGAELDALRGARAMIERFRPALCVEVHPRALAAAGQDPGTLHDLLVDLGYELSAGSQPCLRAQFEQEQIFEFQAWCRGGLTAGAAG